MDSTFKIRVGACALAGGLLGYWFRPSIPLVGQLPFSAVITRGANLSGFDVILKSFAEQSFNYLIGGLILGAGAGFVLTRTLWAKSASTAGAPQANH